MDPNLRQRCEQHLRRTLRAARVRLLVHGAVAWFATAGGAMLAMVLVLGFRDPPRWIRLGLVGTGLALGLLLAWSLLWRPWRQLRRRRDLARHLDRQGGFNDTLGAAEESLRLPQRWTPDSPVREALLSRLLARSIHLLDGLALWRLLPVPRPFLVFSVLILVLALGYAVDRQLPRVHDRGWERVLQPWASTEAPAGGLRLMPGPDHVIAGDDLTLAAIDLLGGEDPLQCEIRAGSGLWRPIMAREAIQPDADPVLGPPFRRWEAVLTEVRDDFVYRFRLGERVSRERSITVWHPPLLTRLAAQVVPPAYTGLPPRDLAQLPAFLEVPVGSDLALNGLASRPLEWASVITAERDTLALTVVADSMSGMLPLSRPMSFHLAMLDDRGLSTSSDLVHEVMVIPDRLPVVRLQRPNDDGRLPLTAPLDLMFAADDDYGLSGVNLLLRRGDPDGGVWVADLGNGQADEDGWERIDLGPSGRREVETSLGRMTVTVTPQPGDGVRLNLSLNPGSLALVPGDVLELAGEARDNRVPLPAGVGRSAILRLQVPSSLDLLRARDEAESGRQDELAETRRRAEALGRDLERLRRELLKDPAPDWNRRQELQDVVRQQQELQAEMSRLARELQQDLESLAASRLTSPEIMEKMDRIAELMADSQRGDLQDQLDKLKEQLEEMSSKELSRAMEDMAENQTEMLRRLNAATNMLEDLAREQEMEGLTDLVAEMISKQQELAEASREAEGEQDQEGESSEGSEDSGEEGQSGEEGEPSEEDESGEKGEPGDSDQEGDQSESGESGETPDPEDLARRQEALSKELESLEERMKETLEQMEKQAQDGDQTAAEQEMKEALEKALEQMKEQQTSKKMDQAGEQLKQDQSQQAAQQMDQALTDLAGLYHVLLRSKVAMQMAMQAEQSGQMRDLASQLLMLSERQEQLGLDLPTSLRDVRVDDLARRQHLVLGGTMAVRDGLEEVSGDAPQEIMRMLKELDDLLEILGRGIDQLEEGRASSARSASDAALADMNRLVISLLTQAQMNGQGGGSGQSQPMLSQQLQQMSEQQAQLNAMAEALRQKQGRISQETRAGMQRLQQGQKGLAGQARELAEEQEARAEQQGGQRVLGDLEELAREMESVGDDLAGGLITPETLRRQDRILGRLLDMHNASRERDWARRRESRSSDELYAEQEGQSAPDEDQVQPEARRWRSVEEAPPAYRDLVREYYREIRRLHESVGRQGGGQP